MFNNLPNEWMVVGFTPNKLAPSLRVVPHAAMPLKRRLVHYLGHGRAFSYLDVFALLRSPGLSALCNAEECTRSRQTHSVW